MTAADDADLVALGAVTRAQGIRGQVRVKLFNPDSEVLFDLREVYLRRDGILRLVRLREPPRAHQGDVVLWPVDCSDRNQAEGLRGHEVCVNASALPKLPPGEYYHRDLIGLPVRETSGNPVGTLVRVDGYPTVDVAVVKTPQGELEIPIIDPYWVDADMQNRCVIVDHIDHLRELLRSTD